MAREVFLLFLSTWLSPPLSYLSEASENHYLEISPLRLCVCVSESVSLLPSDGELGCSAWKPEVALRGERRSPVPLATCLAHL